MNRTQKTTWIAIAGLLALLLVSAPAAAGGRGAGAEPCSLRGTWYGYNNIGNVWILTISRSGPDRYSVVMDSGVNQLFPGTTASTNARGELVKTGRRSYAWTTMFYVALDETYEGIPYGLIYAPLEAKMTSCDTFKGKGAVELYGFFHGQDPLVEGIPFGPGETIKAFFRRMPMTSGGAGPE